MISTTGLPARLQRPLDFVVLSDHAEGLGLITEAYKSNPVLMGDSTLQRWNRMMKAGGVEAAAAVTEVIGAQASNTLPPVLTDPKVVGPLMMSVWQRSAVMADKYNEPGKFTTFIGFEWTPTPGGDNLHRNVVLRDGADRAGQVFPFSSWQSEDPEKLWEWTAAYEQRTGPGVRRVTGSMPGASRAATAPRQPRIRSEPSQQALLLKPAEIWRNSGFRAGGREGNLTVAYLKHGEVRLSLAHRPSKG